LTSGCTRGDATTATSHGIAGARDEKNSRPDAREARAVRAAHQLCSRGLPVDPVGVDAAPDPEAY